MNAESVVVTIDGPAGTGKSTVARRLAHVLGYEYLDTGAMYRMIACEAISKAVDLNSAEEVYRVASSANIEFCNDAAIVNGEDVTDQLRSPEVAVAASLVAQNSKVRDILVQRQREIADGRHIVCEGRDQGTVVFPHARHKFYLTAAPEVRAQRRLEELLSQGKDVSYQQLLAEQNERDERDANRAVAPLKPAVDAEIVDTTMLAIDEVVEKLKKQVLDESK